MSMGWCTALLAAFAGGLLVSQWRHVRRTTLVEPWLWSLVAIGAVGGVELWLAARGGDVSAWQQSMLRYLAAVGLSCPLVAVLGAKRPQHRAWNWTVGTLWGVLALPAIHAWAAQAGADFRLGGPWALFVLVLVAMTVLTYGPTRQWFAAVLVSLAQGALLAPYLPWTAASVGWRADRGAFAAATLLVIAVAWGIGHRPGRRAREHDSPQARVAARWRGLRDGWGAFWAVRLAARLNQTAELQDWPVRATLQGFVPHTSASSREPNWQQIGSALDALLWRFESRETTAGQEDSDA
jgi:hypothetical protein